MAVIGRPGREFRDVGEPTLAGKYTGTDRVYGDLVGKLADYQFNGVSAELRTNILDYFRDRQAPALPSAKKAGAEWAKVIEQLDRLQAIPRLN